MNLVFPVIVCKPHLTVARHRERVDEPLDPLGLQRCVVDRERPPQARRVDTVEKVKTLFDTVREVVDFGKVRLSVEVLQQQLNSGMLRMLDHAN